MEHSVYVKEIANAFANGESGYEVCLFRHKIILTLQEADTLVRGLHDALGNYMVGAKIDEVVK